MPEGRAHRRPSARRRSSEGSRDFRNGTAEDDVEYDVAAAEGKVGSAASIAAVDMIGRRAAQRAACMADDGAKDERDLGGIYGRAIDDEAVRYRITNAKLLIHDADSFSNQSRSDQRTSSKVSQTQSSTPKHRGER